MSMREHFQAFYKVLTADETLLRLLYYKPVNAMDNPLAINKPNILNMQNKWEVIDDVIKTTPKTEDLTVTKGCRLLFYLGKRDNTTNYLFASQEIIFDVLVAMDWEEKDQRQSWICDRVNELVFDNRITGLGKVLFRKGAPMSSPEGFVGFRLVYEIASENY